MADICEFYHVDGRLGVGEVVVEAIADVLGPDIQWEALSVRNIRVKEQPVPHQPGNWNRWDEMDIFLGDEKIGRLTRI